MRKITFFKTWLVAIAIVAGSASMSAQLLTEDFNYTVGALLNANGWSAHSGAGTNSEAVTTSSISYAGYIGSGVGNEVTLATSGEDINKAFTSQNAGSLYASFLVKVTAATTTGDYFAHFAQTSGTTVTVFGARLWAKKDASNNLAFGISKTSTAGNQSYTGFNYVLGTTYLVVIKYNFISGTGNDTEDIFINPAIGSPEPTPTVSTTVAADNAGTDLTAIVSFCLRQGSATNAPNVIVDGIRVSTLWTDLVGPTTDINPASSTSYIYSSNGKVTFTSGAGRTLEIYNSVGQRIISTKTVEGLNTIPVSTRGVVLVKVDKRIARVIL